LQRFKTQFKPIDPILVQAIHNNHNLTTLALSHRSLMKAEAELLFLALDPTRTGNQGNIRVLNLAKNNLHKEGAKIIAQLLEVNTTIEYLDISGNLIGVSGGKALGSALLKNRTLKGLSVFNNRIGFDGAKAFGDSLKVNTRISFIEFGHNRIRNKGLLAIAEGIHANPNTSVTVLGLRFNFLTEEGIIDLLRLIHSNKQQQPTLRELFIKNNAINEYGLFNLKKFYDEQSYTVKLDLFQKLTLIEESKLERTIWVHPSFDEATLKQFFEKTHDCGVVIDVRTRKGLAYSNRDQAHNRFNFVEFADKNSLTRAMALASRRKTNLNGVTFRVFKAGTGTYQCIHPHYIL
jgi:hypothetical protein